MISSDYEFKVDPKQCPPLYFLSTDDNMDKSIIKPRIPETLYKRFEDYWTPRICFSDSIDGCLSSICPSDSTELYVYQPYKEALLNSTIWKPTIHMVKDARFNHEYWILNELQLRKVGKIIANKVVEKIHKNSGRGRVTIFKYSYKILYMEDKQL